LDIDRTLFGDVTPASDQWYVLTNLRRLQIAGGLPESFVLPEMDMGAVFDGGLLRPGFLDFRAEVERALAPHGGAEFFLYTTSMRDWAAHEIDCLERHLKIRFNRPLFCREEHTVSSPDKYGRKSLRLVMPEIRAALASRYPAVAALDEAGAKNMDATRVVFVDDIPNNTFESSPNQLVCQAYEGTVPFEPSLGMPLAMRNHEAVRYS
jgi:hypothetical protein